MRVKMAAAEAANCIMEVSAWSAVGGGGQFEGQRFMPPSWGRGSESPDWG